MKKAQNNIRKISETLEKTKFPLTKWASNKPQVMQHVDGSRRIESYVELHKSEGSIKTSGLH